MSQFKFSVGPWNVHEGADAFGPDVRGSIPFEEKIKKFKEMAWMPSSSMMTMQFQK